MSGTEGGGEAAAYIPPELFEEILSWLPSNDLINFKLVCKDWLRFISTTGFIQKHLERSKADCNHSKILFLLESTSTIEILDECAHKKIDLKASDILGSCDGLVLYYDKWNHRIAAFNPSTGEYDVVPIPNQSIEDGIEHERLVFTWFGHHPSTGEYVLVVANFLNEETAGDRNIVFRVYSLARNNIICSSTLRLSADSMIMMGYPKVGTLLHGKLHWLPISIHNDCRVLYAVILVYDFETNKIRRIMSPAPVECCQTLGVVDGCLSVLIFEQKQVWVMKEYGVKESWTKYADIEGMGDGDILIPLGFCPRIDGNTGDVKLLRVSKYCFREREIQILKTYTDADCMPYEATVCIDSLVSPTLLWNWREDE